MGRPTVLLVIATTMGGFLLLLPFLPWYSAELPAGTVRVSGVSASGELWIVPAMGVAAILAGLVALRRGPGLVSALTIGVAGALAAAWALKNTATLPVRTVVERADGVSTVDAAVTLDPAAPGTVVAAVVVALVGGLLALRAWMAE